MRWEPAKSIDGLQYLIQCRGYDTLRWEPAKLIDGLQAADQFPQCYPENTEPQENSSGDHKPKWGILSRLGSGSNDIRKEM